MDRIRAIDGLAAALEDAFARADWDRLGLAVQALGPRLQELARAGRWNAAERAALARLRGAHERARAGVDAASAQVQARLDEMAGNKEGWMAYALEGELDTEQDHA
ncbi:hypothetical protein [Massilia sp. ST3]|uniref:hypothetical protein n=1 Tax=Massilia sp. ST3 TaxID=2824903 RepID=UPI001B8161B7|nr:hypothetical protein [Massilia sp. ST3]MBQ5948362.1 hypothetical protein [Massilia sp. ST3]